MLAFHFAIIINDQIRFVSQPDYYAQFEMAVFANLLIRQIAENRPWSLHKILFQKIGDENHSTLLIQRKTNSEYSTDVLFCLLGDLTSVEKYASQLLDQFANAILEKWSINALGDLLEYEYESLQLESIKLVNSYDAQQVVQDEQEINPLEYAAINQMVYAGISSSGLPIAQQLYEHQAIFAIDSPTKKEIITTILSGQLATITMNALIRAQSRIKSIQIKIDDRSNHLMILGFQDFGFGNTYTLEMLYSGDAQFLESLTPKILLFLENSDMFNETFTGSKKGFSPIQKYLEDLESVFEDLEYMV